MLKALDDSRLNPSAQARIAFVALRKIFGILLFNHTRNVAKVRGPSAYQHKVFPYFLWKSRSADLPVFALKPFVVVGLSTSK